MQLKTMLDMSMEQIVAAEASFLKLQLQNLYPLAAS